MPSDLSSDTGEKKGANGLRVIGIGSSAGGLEAIRELASNLAPNGICTYVIVQHMSPQHKSLMTSLIASETTLKVTDVEDGQVPEADTIYVAPPRADVVMVDGRLRLVEPSPEAGRPKPSVNRFLISLAQEKGEQSMGIILSGTGSDGSYGIQAIREVGGITIAQDDASAKYDGMANAAIETGCIDLVLRPSQIGEHLQNILSSADDLEKFRNSRDVSTPLSTILQIVLARTRVDFREYKSSTIQRRVERRMTALGINRIEDYATHCRNAPQEVDALYKDFLISVTRFFRDNEEFKRLRKPITELVKKRSGNPLRIWVAGCATGEEVYSIAILLAEAMGGPTELVKSRTQIFATDIDMSALESARRGFYPSAALADVPEELRDKYFIAQNDGVRVIEALRSTILFSDHNLCQDPPFLNMDLICCRNVLIYFGPGLQSKVLARLHYAMRPDAYLFLGTAENASGADQLFAAADEAGHIFKRRNLKDRERYDLKTISGNWQSRPLANSLKKPLPPEVSGERQMFDALARAVGDNAVLVSQEHSFMRVYGDISEFVDLSESSPLDLRLSLLRSPLREEARSIVTLALKHGERRLGGRHAWGDNEILRLEALPLVSKNAEENTALLVFTRWHREELEAAHSPSDGKPGTEISVEHLRELDMELANTREALQQTIEELETSNEELQALNEELQSTNEELQATNEELETSNEELQSTNEELITVNEELQVNSSELLALNAELGSVLGNVPVPLLVLDNAMQINRASNGAIELFNIAKPLSAPHLSQIALPDGFPMIVDTCNEALRTGQMRQLEFEAGGDTYTMQCEPFLGEANQIHGTTIVFMKAAATK